VRGSRSRTFPERDGAVLFASSPATGRCTSRPLAVSLVLSKGFKLLPPTPRAVGADGKRVSAVLMQGPNLFDFRRFLPTRGTSPGPNNVEGSLSRSRLGEDPRSPQESETGTTPADRSKEEEIRGTEASSEILPTFLVACCRNSPG
jgi:hypothetical protein